MAEVKIHHFRDGHHEEHTFHVHDPKGERMVKRMHKALSAHVKSGRERGARENYGEPPRALLGPEKKVRKGRRIRSKR